MHVRLLGERMRNVTQGDRQKVADLFFARGICAGIKEAATSVQNAPAAVPVSCFPSFSDCTSFNWRNQAVAFFLLTSSFKRSSKGTGKIKKYVTRILAIKNSVLIIHPPQTHSAWGSGLLT